MIMSTNMNMNITTIITMSTAMSITTNMATAMNITMIMATMDSAAGATIAIMIMSMGERKTAP